MKTLPTQILIAWDTEDALTAFRAAVTHAVLKTVTERDAACVLQRVLHDHDANTGLTWDVLEMEAAAFITENPTREERDAEYDRWLARI